MTPTRGRTKPASSLEAAIVARMYYLAGLQKNEIAEQLGLSRFKVARLLEEALASGIVHIQVDVPTDLDLDLGDRVAARYGIRTVIAARVIDDDPDSIAAILGAAGAELLTGIIGPEDVLGLSWGRTLTYLVTSFAKQSGTDVVQLVGGVNSGNSEIGGVELVRRMSTKTEGHAFSLLAPLVVGSSDIAKQLRNDPSLRTTTDRFKDLTIAVMGVGSWAPPNSMVYNETTESERQSLRELRATGDVCGIVFDADGRELDSVLQGRRIGIASRELAKIPERIAAAGGPTKTAAIATALRSGMLTTLVTDTRTAQRLLDL